MAPYSSLIGQVRSGRRRGERGRGEADHGQAAGRRQHPAGAAVRAAQVELCNFDIDIGLDIHFRLKLTLVRKTNSFGQRHLIECLFNKTS